MIRLVWLSLWLTIPVFAETPITLWHSMSGDKSKLLQSIAADFNGSQTKIQLKVQYVGTYIEGLNKLRAALMAKRGPHIAQIFDIGTKVIVDAKAATPLQDFIAQDPSFPADELLPQIRGYYEMGGRLQALPFATSTPILYYNANEFKKAGITKPPATFRELAEVARKLTDPKRHVTGITWPLHSWIVEEFVAKQGATLADGDNGRTSSATQLDLAGAPAKKIVALWSEMVKEGTFANVGRNWDPAVQNFLAGRSAMLITSTSEVFEVIKRAQFPVATAFIPGPDEKAAGGTVLGGNALWIMGNKPVEEQKAAYEVVKFMASKDVQRKWHTQTGYFPIRADLIKELEAEGFYKKNPAAWTAIEQLRASPVMPATRGALLGVFSEVREYVESAVESVLAGTSSEDQALGKAKLQADAALTRYNRLRSR